MWFVFKQKRISQNQLILPLMYEEAPSNLVAKIPSTYLMMPISTVLYSVSLAYWLLQASHSASLATFPFVAESSSLPASYFLFLAAANWI